MDRLARMRDYYRRNKDKWKQYRKAKRPLAKEEKEKRSEYHRKYYKANREKVLKRQKARPKSPGDAAYKAMYYQQNKSRIAAQRKEHYHKVVKQRAAETKQNAPYVRISVAAKMVGCKLRALREWVYTGKFPAIKTPAGMYLLARTDVDELRRSIPHLPPDLIKQLGIKKAQ